jgi:hypothetical protein
MANRLFVGIKLLIMQIIKSIQNRIYEITGERVMPDFDIAQLYEVETKVLNQAVKRNITRFPKYFMFRLTQEEWTTIRSQFVTASCLDPTKIDTRVATNQKRRNINLLPYAFTEQGFSMLSGVLRSGKAVSMNIAMMRAFVAVRKLAASQSDFNEQLKAIRERLGEHYSQLNQIYDALENMMDEKAAERKWQDRDRIGFKK